MFTIAVTPFRSASREFRDEDAYNDIFDECGLSAGNFEGVATFTLLPSGATVI